MYNKKNRIILLVIIIFIFLFIIGVFFYNFYYKKNYFFWSSVKNNIVIRLTFDLNQKSEKYLNFASCKLETLKRIANSDMTDNDILQIGLISYINDIYKAKHIFEKSFKKQKFDQRKFVFKFTEKVLNDLKDIDKFYQFIDEKETLVLLRNVKVSLYKNLVLVIDKANYADTKKIYISLFNNIETIKELKSIEAYVLVQKLKSYAKDSEKLDFLQNKYFKEIKLVYKNSTDFYKELSDQCKNKIIQLYILDVLSQDISVFLNKDELFAMDLKKDELLQFLNNKINGADFKVVDQLKSFFNVCDISRVKLLIRIKDYIPLLLPGNDSFNLNTKYKACINPVFKQQDFTIDCYQEILKLSPVMEDFYFISYLIRNFDIKKNKTKGVFDKNIDLLYKNIENRENSLDLYFLWLTSPEPFIFKIFLDLKNNFISKLTNKHYRQIKKSFAKRIIYRLLNTSEIVILKNLERQVNLDEIVKKELTELEPDLDKRIKKRKMEIDLKTKKTILKVEKYDKQKQKEIQEMIREKRRLELLMQQQDNYWQDY